MVVRMRTEFDVDRVFGALADGTRRDILRRAIGGEEGVAELRALVDRALELDPALLEVELAERLLDLEFGAFRVEADLFAVFLGF